MADATLKLIIDAKPAIESIDAVQELIRSHDALLAEVEALRADNKHLRGEFEKAWPDAERYRWMKAEVKRIPPGWALIGWDAAIDAARKELAERDAAFDAARAAQGGEHG